MKPQPTFQLFQWLGRGRGLRVCMLATLATALLLAAYHRDTAACTQMSKEVLEELEIEAETPAQEQQHPTGWLGSSTCWPAATARGPGQRVASYSFYGDVNHSRGYFQGIARNAAALGRLYPGWWMRIYHDVPLGGDSRVSRELEKLSREIPHLDLCYVGDVPGFGDLRGSQQRAWRFLAMADPLVDVFISRDLDAMLLQREVDAVGEWLRSNATFHVMRDHKGHDCPIMESHSASLKKEVATACARAGKEGSNRMAEQWLKILNGSSWGHVGCAPPPEEEGPAGAGGGGHQGAQGPQARGPDHPRRARLARHQRGRVAARRLPLRPVPQPRTHATLPDAPQPDGRLQLRGQLLWDPHPSDAHQVPGAVQARQPSRLALLLNSTATSLNDQSNCQGRVAARRLPLRPVPQPRTHATLPDAPQPDGCLQLRGQLLWDPHPSDAHQVPGAVPARQPPRLALLLKSTATSLNDQSNCQ